MYYYDIAWLKQIRVYHHRLTVQCTSMGFTSFTSSWYTTYSHSTDCSDTVWPFMVRSCTELLKSTFSSLQNLTVDSAARFSQILQEWSMVKNLSCVSCAAWNIFPINSLLWVNPPDGKLVNSVSVQFSVVGTKKVRNILSWRKKA